MTREGGSQLRLTRLGAYEVLRPLAQGGMADIYLARKEGPGQLGRPVALKVLNERRAVDTEACALFLHEARVCALLTHQNIATVLDVDVADGLHYLAMEYVHGVDLRELLSTAARASRSVPYETAIAIVAAAAAGLDHAHRRCDGEGQPLRLVHRDVSLSNIMAGHDGAVKVVDFGIASTTISSVHTMPGVVRGKASYMSPEQCLGDQLDHRTDVFALGVVLYELTTGARCFHGKNDFERMLAVVRGDYIAPSTLAADYPPELEHVVRTALAPSADRRYASCAEMIEALEAVLADRGWTGGSGAIARLMAELFPAGVAPAAPDADADADADLEPAATARQSPLALAESGAIPLHALAVAGAPTAPKQPLARGSATELAQPVVTARLESAAVAEAYPKQERVRFDDDDAPTRGRRALRRPGSARTRSLLAA